MLLINIVWVQIVTPLRMSFEDKRNVYFSIAILDSIFDLIFLIDNITIFFIPLANTEGDYILSRKYTAKRYLITWFFLDLIGDIPFSIFKYYKRPSMESDM